MAKCRCEVCCPDNPAPTYTEQFRHECEVRAVVAMASNARRRSYLEKVEKRRGAAAADRIRTEAWELMRRGA